MIIIRGGRIDPMIALTSGGMLLIDGRYIASVFKLEKVVAKAIIADQNISRTITIVFAIQVRKGIVRGEME
jgi:hypothetical protein